MEKCNTMCNDSTIITLNKTTLGKRTLTKIILQIFLCSKCIWIYKHNVLLVFYYILQVLHALYLQLTPIDAYLLVACVPKINELLFNTSIKFPHIYFNVMRWIIHPCWHIAGNKWAQTNEIKNYQVAFFYHFWKCAFESNPAPHYHSWPPL